MGAEVAQLISEAAQVAPGMPVLPGMPATRGMPATCGIPVTRGVPGAGVVPEEDGLPVLPALRDLLPGGSLQRGSVAAVGSGQAGGGWGLLCLALVAAASADGAWCAAVGLPHLGVRAAADAGVDPDRLLLVADPGPGWPQVVVSLLDGCGIVLLRPPAGVLASVRRRVEAAVRRLGGVLVVAGEWEGTRARLCVTRQEWSGLGAGHGRLRARRALVMAEGRGAWSRPRERWLWLPGPDGSVTLAGPPRAAAAPATPRAAGVPDLPDGAAIAGAVPLVDRLAALAARPAPAAGRPATGAGQPATGTGQPAGTGRRTVPASRPGPPADRRAAAG